MADIDPLQAEEKTVEASVAAQVDEISLVQPYPEEITMDAPRHVELPQVSAPAATPPPASDEKPAAVEKPAEEASPPAAEQPEPVTVPEGQIEEPAKPAETKETRILAGVHSILV